MMLLHKLRLVLAGILVALGATVVAQVSAPAFRVEYGTLTLTLDGGCSDAPQFAIPYAKVDRVVTLMFLGSYSCTSDSTSGPFGSGDVPAALRPVGTVRTIGVARIVDNSVTGDHEAVCVEVDAAGTVTFGRGDPDGIPFGDFCSDDSNFTASGTKAIEFPAAFSGMAVTYLAVP